MITISRLSGQLQRLFERDAPYLAQQLGLRQRVFGATRLALLLVLGWLQHPQAGPSALARFAGKLGISTSKQAVQEHFTMQTATWLLALLRQAVEYLVCAQAVSLPLLQRFRGVFVEDGSTISLPAVLKTVWRGCGGSSSPASLKLTVRWDLLSGQLAGPYVQEGRAHESSSPLQQQPMRTGSLWMADLGYFALKRLLAFIRQGIYFLLRYKPGVLLWNAQGQLLDLVHDLPQQEGELFDQPVRLGASKQVQARLLAQKVPPRVVEQRREQLKERAHKQNKPINPLLWELVQWTILLTNVPGSLLSAQEAFGLQRARWQIELLFKLWKEHGKVDEWTTSKPERILCEVYAKLLAMLVQHWLLLLSCWQDPHRSLECCAEVVREQVPLLVYGLTRQMSLTTALRLLCQALAGECSIPARQTRLSTSRLLLGEQAPGLT